MGFILFILSKKIKNKYHIQIQCDNSHDYVWNNIKFPYCQNYKKISEWNLEIWTSYCGYYQRKSDISIQYYNLHEYV